MNAQSPARTDKLHDNIVVIHTSAWAKADPPRSMKEAHEREMLNALRKLSVELLKREVATTVMEGVYLTWWFRIACLNHRFAVGGFEQSLLRLGPLIGPVCDILMRLGQEIEYDGPVSELKLVGEKLEEVKAMAGGSMATRPPSGEAETAQTKAAHELIQQTVLLSIDTGIPPEVIEGLLLYFWFRCAVNRYGVREVFFQKLEQRWDLVMEHVNRYMDDQAAADRRKG
jgi:hypothetical protein